MSLVGMAWDHPRAYRPLDAFAGLGRGPAVRWDRQSLADFEAHPIAELARRYDLLIVDHPGLGAALAGGALRPLDDIADPATLARWRAGSVAGTWASYELDGRAWAAPVDAATQVTVLRPDLVERPPGSWREVVEFAGRKPVALCLGGPHALLCLLGMCASAGAAVAEGSAGASARGLAGGLAGGSNAGAARAGATWLVEPGVAVAAIEVLRAVWARADRQVSLGNPIEVHEALATGEVALCPLAYGYASYARPAPGAHPLRWADAPTFGSERPGCVLGGTGLAVSAHSRATTRGDQRPGAEGSGAEGCGDKRRGAEPDEVRAWLSGYLDPTIQSGLVPDSGGQPAAVAAWDRADVDAAWGGYYSSTRRSLEHAYLRPRLDGWIALQEQASALVREAVTRGGDAAAAVAAINDRYRVLAGTVVPPGVAA